MSDYMQLEEQNKEAKKEHILGEIPDFPLYVKYDTMRQIPVSIQANMFSSNQLIPFYQFITFTIRRYLIQDPFMISLKDFQNLSIEDAETMHKEVFKQCKELLNESWKNGTRHVIICNKKIIYTSKDLEDISNEIVEQLAEKYNKACYVFSAPDMVEECVWTRVDEKDFYPTLKLHVGLEDSDENQVITTVPIYADFDTGNPYLCAFDLSRFKVKFNPLHIRQAEHLKKLYTFFTQKIKICVKDEGNKIHSITRQVRLVKDWKNCALLQASPNRAGFVGRDLMRDLDIKVELNPVTKNTRILQIISTP